MLGKSQSLFNLYVLTFLCCSLFQFSKHKICEYLDIHKLSDYKITLKYRLILPTHETQFDINSLISDWRENELILAPNVIKPVQKFN